MPAIAGPLLASLVSCYDGDSCRFDVPVWPDITVRVMVRMRGIDAPEIRGKCVAEKALAVTARDFLSATIEASEDVELRLIEHDKYAGRVVADILVDGQPVAELLIDQGLARPYDGGAREGWC